MHLHPLKVKIVKNQSLEHHYILPYEKLTKISHFKTNTSSQSDNYSESVPSMHHILTQ